MSVLKMVIADDHYYICGEVHGSRAQWIYAACSRSPGSLDELDRLLPEFGAKESLLSLFGHTSALDLAPVDAGLIIVDLAKKWVYAENTYFSAHRRGRYQSQGEGETIITYEFPEKWQFVAEAKWFNYLWSCGLSPYNTQETSASESKTGAPYTLPDNQDRVLRRDQEISWEDLSPLLESVPVDTGFEDEYKEIWDEEMAGIEVEFANRWTGLIYFEPQDSAEERDLQTLEHIIRYEQQAAAAQHQIQQARKEIASLQIELQAVENLWKREPGPRWGLKRIHLQARIERQEERISRLTDRQNEAIAMAGELRNLGITGKFHEALKLWRDEAE